MQAIKLQFKDIYPDISDASIDQVLLLAEGRVQAYIDLLALQLQQLNVDLTEWVDQAVQDIADMDVPFVAMGDEEAEGMNPAQIAVHNAHVLHTALQQERGVRTELAVELVAIWQKRGPLQDRVYVDGQLRGVRLDLTFEDFHRLPTLNARLNDVIELSMHGFHLTEHESLNGFLEGFPNLEVLNLEGFDLRPFFVGGDAGRALPPVIGQLPKLVSLNLRATQLAFTERAASQLSDLTHLQTLDLSDNPLGVPPVVLGMNNLRQLNLRNTAINRCPVGVKDEPYLTMLDLRDNHITRVPPAIINQAVADDRVLLWGNPLTDEDTLHRLISHREQTGINLWLSAPGADYGTPTVWLRDCDEVLQQSRQALWQRLAGKPSGTRFLAVIDRLSLTADFRVSYLSLQARVWRLLQEADASEDMWGRIIRGSGRFDHPMAAFRALEARAGF
ncbi:hypothetical protein PS870_01806 [Pseudomonas fluorescens]|uniref:RING-type E3 ubiquitin transferase n=1 Tax=Pseudomonas fluorescens TaxID=294 RepID=A0A5E7IVR0_PSEFL|nr:hypothetical protein PS870_01806 [Pseudomonas fluorescens]